MDIQRLPQISMHTPIGDLTISSENNLIISIDWGWAQDQEQTTLLQTAKSQLDGYFDGHRKSFHLPLAPQGSEYQRRVWATLSKIPYGKTVSYGQLAATLNSSPRAVGAACGANPVPIVIPCHRVVSANGIGGYSGDGGVKTKIALLSLEEAFL